MTTCAIEGLLICGQTQEILENIMKHENKMKITIMKNLKQNRLPRFGTALLITLLFAMVASNTWAALSAYEPYNYAIGARVGYASGTPTQTQGGGFSSGYNGNPGAPTAAAGHGPRSSHPSSPRRCDENESSKNTPPAPTPPNPTPRPGALGYAATPAGCAHDNHSTSFYAVAVCRSSAR